MERPRAATTRVTEGRSRACRAPTVLRDVDNMMRVILVFMERRGEEERKGTVAEEDLDVLGKERRELGVWVVWVNASRRETSDVRAPPVERG